MGKKFPKWFTSFSISYYTFWWNSNENQNKKNNRSYRCMKICIKLYLCKFSWVFMVAIIATNMLQLYNANFWYGFNPFKMAVQFFRLHEVFPIFMVQMRFSQIQQAPGPDFRKVRKSLTTLFSNFCPVNLEHVLVIRVENSVDLDQMALLEASWSVFSKKENSSLSRTRVTWVFYNPVKAKKKKTPWFSILNWCTYMRLFAPEWSKLSYSFTGSLVMACSWTAVRKCPKIFLILSLMTWL